MAQGKKGAKAAKPPARETVENRESWNLTMQQQFVIDLRYWADESPRYVVKVLSLVEECRRNPRDGTGKVEQLRHHGADAKIWSRRISGEHRLVYIVDEQSHSVDFLSCRYHYV